MFMIVSADGDPSNVEKLTPGGSVEDWRLVPNDNNIAQRNVTLAPGGGGSDGLMAGLDGVGFWVGNPGRAAARVAVSVKLPPLLAERKWRIDVDLPADGARLKAHEQRLVTLAVHPGAPFAEDDVERATERNIVITATADGALIGGMTYHLDPKIKMPHNPRTVADVTLRLRIVAAHGAFFNKPVDIEVKHRTLASEPRQVFRRVIPSDYVLINDLRRFPQSDYIVTVTPSDWFHPESEFVTIPPSGTAELTFVIEHKGS